MKLRLRLAAAALVVAAVGALSAGSASGAVNAAEPSYPTTSTKVSADGMWRASANAWTTNLVAVKIIGVTVTVQHKEWVCTGPFCWGGHVWQWVDRPASSISIRNGYTPFPVTDPRPCPPANCIPPAPTRNCYASGKSSLQCLDWAVFTGPAQLNIKSVVGTAQVVVPGATLGLGPVSDSFWF